MKDSTTNARDTAQAEDRADGGATPEDRAGGCGDDGSGSTFCHDDPTIGRDAFMTRVARLVRCVLVLALLAVLLRLPVFCENATFARFGLVAFTLLGTLVAVAASVGLWGGGGADDDGRSSGRVIDPWFKEKLERLRANDQSLTMLNVEKRQLDANDAVALADALKDNTTLTTLRLNDNGIGIKGAVALAEMLKVNTTLTALYVGGNEIGDDGAAALADALESNTTLTTINVRSNKARLSQRRKIEDWATRNRVLKNHEEAAKEHREVFYVRRIDTPPEKAATTNASESGVSLCWSTGRWMGKSHDIDEAYSARSWEPDIGSKGPTEENLTAASESYDDSGEETSVSCPIWEAAIGDGIVFRCFLQLFHRRDPPFTLLELKNLINSSKDKDGCTLLHVAAGLDSQVALDLCKFLVQEVGVDFDTITDGIGRTARDIAVGNSNPDINGWARTVGTFLDRYYVEGGLSAPPVNKSSTCTVHFAVDMQLKKGDPNRNVALKRFEKKNHMQRELKIRLNGLAREGDDIPQGVNMFEIDHAVPLLRYHDTPEYDCLVMPMGEKNLHQIINSEQIAGKDLDKVHAYGLDIAKALDHLHSKKKVHGDFTPRNVVRINGYMKLIDFDASVGIGNKLTERYSSAYIPPEVARGKFRITKDLGVLEQELDKKRKQRNHAEDEGDYEKASSLGKECGILLEKIKCASAPNQPTTTTAQVGMDIWAFGATMYFLCTGKTLFSTDPIGDNIDGESERFRLVNWSGLDQNDLNHVLEESRNQEAREAAQEFLKKCLHKDPDRRFQTVNDLLSHRFLKKSYSSVEGKMENIARHQAENTKTINSIDKKMDVAINRLSEIQGGLETMQDQLQKSLRKMTYGILKSSPAPRLLHIVSEELSFKDLFDPSITKKNVRVYFICPVTFSVPRDALGNPVGYDLELPRDWVKKYGPAFFISLTVLKVAFAIGRLTGLPLPNLTSVGENSNVLQVVADNVLDFMQNEEVAEGLAPKLQEVAEAMETVTTISVPVDGPEISSEKKLSGDQLQARHDYLEEICRSYQEVKKIAEHKKDPEFQKSGLVKAVHVDSIGDVSEEYVLPDVVKHFEEKGKECLGWSRDELFHAKIAMMEVVVEGELEKQSLKKRRQWKGKQQYFILRQSGFLTYYDSKDLRDIDFMGVKGKTMPERVIEVEGMQSTANGQHELMLTYAGGGTQLFRAASPEERRRWLKYS